MVALSAWHTPPSPPPSAPRRVVQLRIYSLYCAPQSRRRRRWRRLATKAFTLSTANGALVPLKRLVFIVPTGQHLQRINESFIPKHLIKALIVFAFFGCSPHEYWQYGLWSFQTGGIKLERFLLKNQHTQRKLLNFENWVSGEVSKIGHHFSK